MLINRKWKNILLAASGLTFLLLITEVVPRISDLFSSLCEITDGDIDSESIAETDSLLIEEQLKNKVLEKKHSSFASSEKSGGLSSILEVLENNAASSGIDFTEIRPTKPSNQKGMIIQPIDISFSSGFNELYRFLQLADSTGKIIKIKSFQSSINNDGNTINTKIKLEAYLNL